MKILPNGQVEITNFDTGEKRIVSPNELTNYGIEPNDYKNALGASSVGSPVKTYTPTGFAGGTVNVYKPTTPQLNTTTQNTTQTTLKPMTLDEKIQWARSKGYSEAEISDYVKKQTGTQTQSPTPVVPEKKKGIVESVAGFLAPRLTGLANQAVNIPLMAKDILEYQAAKTPEEKRKQLIEYNQKRNIINEDQKKYGFDINKKDGQFDPVQYAKGTSKGALEAASIAAPGGTGVKGMAIAGALSGTARGLSEGEDFDLDAAALGALGGAVAGGTIGVIGKGLGAVKNKFGDLATKEFNKATPSVFRKALEEKGVDVNVLSNDLVRKYNLGGSTYDDILGTAAEKGRGGVFGKAMKDAEAVIQNRVKDSKVVIPGDSVITGLKTQLSKLEGKLGEEPKRAALEKIIAEAEKKYAQGITPQQAVKLIRDANETFGKSIIDVGTNDAVVSASQKLEANAIKRVLKAIFPDIADALDEQSKILTLRPILNQARATLSTQGSTIRKGMLSNIDITKPFTLLTGPVEAAVNNPKVSSLLMSGSPAVFGKASLGKFPGVIGGVVGAKVGASFGGNGEQNNSEINNQIDNNVGYEQTNNQPYHDSSLPPSPQEVNLSTPTYATGQSPEYWNMQYQQAMMQNPADEVTAKYALEQRDYEMKFQKENSPAKPKALSVAGSKELSRNQTAYNDIIELEKILKNNPNEFIQAAIPGSLGARKYRSLWGGILDAIGTNRTGATYTPEQRKDYVHLLPVVGDTPQVVQDKMTRIKLEVQNYIKNISSSVPDVYQEQGLGATPPSL